MKIATTGYLNLPQRWPCSTDHIWPSAKSHIWPVSVDRRDGRHTFVMFVPKHFQTMRSSEHHPFCHGFRPFIPTLERAVSNNFVSEVRLDRFFKSSGCIGGPILRAYRWGGPKPAWRIRAHCQGYTSHLLAKMYERSLPIPANQHLPPTEPFGA